MTEGIGFSENTLNIFMHEETIREIIYAYNMGKDFIEIPMLDKKNKKTGTAKIEFRYTGLKH